MYKKLILLSLPFYLFSNQFDVTLQDELEWLEEETFVVSASKIKENIRKTSASISVIESETIKKMGARNFLEIINTLSGINISETYIYQKKISVRGIQGNFSEKVLILLDGHSLNVDLLNGGATGAYSNLPIELIDRIEVIKGPASALYGENAFTALINIITKNPRDVNGSEITVKAGKNNTKQINFLFSKLNKNYELLSNLDFLSSNSDSVYVEKDALGNSGHTNPTIENFNAYISLLLKNGVYFKGNVNNIENGPKFGVANAINNLDLSKRKSFFLESGLKKDFDIYNLNTRFYYDFYRINNKWSVPFYTNGIGMSGYDSVKLGHESTIAIKKEDYKLIFGLSAERQELNNPWQKMNWNPITNVSHSSEIKDYSDSNSNFISEVSRDSIGIYSELIYDLSDNIRLNTGIRHDKYSDFGKVNNPRLGLNWIIDKNNTIKFMYGEAFRAPTFAELYNKNNPSIIGNPELKPERVKTLELGLHNNIQNIKTSLTLFNSDIQDIIVLSNSKYKNEDEAETRGIELESKYDLFRGSYFLANYTYQKAINKKTNKDIENIPNHMASLSLNYRINKNYNLFTSGKFLGTQTRGATDTKDKISSSVIFNSTLLIKELFVKNSDFKISIYNIFNEQTKDSSTTIDYPVANRSYLLEFKYKF